VVRPAESEIEQKSDAARTLLRRADSVDRAGTTERDTHQRQIEDIVLDLARLVPDGVADLDVRELLEGLVLLNRATVERREQDALRQSMEMDDIVRRIRARVAHERLDEPSVALAYVLRALEGMDTKRIGSVLGVSAKTVNSWRKGSDIRAANADRLRLVARCAFELRKTMTVTGLGLWFERPVAQLGDRSPVQVMDEDLSTAWESLSDFVSRSHA
jgi:hypothetical protein